MVLTYKSWIESLYKIKLIKRLLFVTYFFFIRILYVINDVMNNILSDVTQNIDITDRYYQRNNDNVYLI